MKVISLNANGIRSASKKGFFEWVMSENADVICLQETKAHLEILQGQFQLPGYHLYFHDAQKPGYSGVAIYSKFKPEAVRVGLGFKAADEEGRYVQLDFADWSVASVYLPSGSSGELRQQVKFAFMKEFELSLHQHRQQNKEMIICGDWNIVHKQIDIKNWTGNQKNSGCLPEERAWLDKILTELSYVDTFRVVNQLPEQYTWWSNRGQAYAKNVGWRIDYQIATPGWRQRIHTADIYKEQRFSDHAPLIVEYK